MAVVQIGEQAGLGGFPAEGPAGDEVGRRVALRDDVREEPEVSRQHQCNRSRGRRAGLKDFLALQEMLRLWSATSWTRRSMLVGMR